MRNILIFTFAFFLKQSVEGAVCIRERSIKFEFVHRKHSVSLEGAVYQFL